MATNWRALCAELEACVQDLLDQGGAPNKTIIDVTCRARAALWSPEDDQPNETNQPTN